MPACYHFIRHLHVKKGFQNLTFSKPAIHSSTLVTQIFDANALISYGKQIKLT